MSKYTEHTHDIGNDQITIDTLIGELAGPNGLKRQDARLKLVEIGRAAVPTLVETLDDQREQVRWEAAKALSQIGDPVAAPALVKALEDENFGVRWLAAEGLIAAGRKGLPPLLQALVHHSDSGWLREGAHHVLRSLVGEPGLHDLIAPVLVALDDIEPVIEVPPAAKEALDAMVDTTHLATGQHRPAQTRAPETGPQRGA
jgi:HEAT repeat protein